MFAKEIGHVSKDLLTGEVDGHLCSKPQDSLDLVILLPVTVYNGPLITLPKAWHGGVVELALFYCRGLAEF